MKRTTAAEAWVQMKTYHETSCGHSFGTPLIDDFSFSGTLYKADCCKCGLALYVSGGWGGASSFGPAAHCDCSPGS